MARSILLVDDSVAIVQFLAKKLHESFPDEEITNSRLANDAFQKAVALRPDIILIDYALPDLKGDDVCRLLYHHPMTALIPVIMFYGDGVDVGRLQTANPNIVATLQKPFKPEALTAEVSKVFSSPRIALEIKARFDTSTYKDLGIASAKVLFRANTSLFPLGTAFRHIAEEKLSGVLRILLKKQPIEVFYTEGRVRMASTKDLQLYSMDSPVQLSQIDREAMATAAKGQMDCSCPYFILLALRGAMDPAQVPELVHSHGLKLVARAFVAQKTYFEFEDLHILPEFIREVPDDGLDAITWAFESLRRIPVDHVRAACKFDHDDVPAFTPDSMRLLGQIKLNPSEERFAREMNGTKTLGQLASTIGLTENEAVALYFRFAALGTAQPWPAAAFQRG